MNNAQKNYIVQRSRPLLSLNQSALSLYELKVLDTYLSRIDSHKPEERTVVFNKGEFEELFDYAKMKMPEMKEHLKNLQELHVDIAKNEEEFDNIALFSRATAAKDRYGLWVVTLTCSPEAMKYFFNIENLGYLRYKLWNVLRLESRYSYLLFLYLVDNRFRKQWIVDLDDLKVLLNCQDVASYQSYKNFRKVVLDKCKDEILNKTNIRFDYSTIKRGKFVQKIEFKITTWGDLSEIMAKEKEEKDKEKEIVTIKDEITIMHELDNTIDKEDVEAIYDLLIQLGVEKRANNIGIIDYYKCLLERVTNTEKTEPIWDKAGCIKRMIINEIEENINPMDDIEIDYGSELANLLGGASLRNEFLPKQVRVIQDLILKKMPYEDDLKRCDYLSKIYNRMNLYNVKKEKRFSYLCRMIENDDSFD